jgi:hypothetical protein
MITKRVENPMFQPGLDPPIDGEKALNSLLSEVGTQELEGNPDWTIIHRMSNSRIGMINRLSS